MESGFETLIVEGSRTLFTPVFDVEGRALFVILIGRKNENDVIEQMVEGRTLFQKIADGDVPADIVYDDDRCIALRDINPQAPTHILIVPRKPIPSLNDLSEDDTDLVGHLIVVAKKLADEEGLDDGYRTVFNCGPAAGQSVDHIHLHLLGGRKMNWPPG